MSVGETVFQELRSVSRQKWGLSANRILSREGEKGGSHWRNTVLCGWRKRETARDAWGRQTVEGGVRSEGGTNGRTEGQKTGVGWTVNILLPCLSLSVSLRPPTFPISLCVSLSPPSPISASFCASLSPHRVIPGAPWSATAPCKAWCPGGTSPALSLTSPGSTPTSACSPSGSGTPYGPTHESSPHPLHVLLPVQGPDTPSRSPTPSPQVSRASLPRQGADPISVAGSRGRGGWSGDVL